MLGSFDAPSLPARRVLLWGKPTVAHVLLNLPSAPVPVKRTGTPSPVFSDGSFYNSLQISAITTLAKFPAKDFQLGDVDKPFPECDFLRAAYFDALSPLQGADELACLEQAVGRSSIEPGLTPSHELDAEFAVLEINLVHICDFQFAAR